jgi:hypothetical protein
MMFAASTRYEVVGIQVCETKTPETPSAKRQICTFIGSEEEYAVAHEQLISA